MICGSDPVCDLEALGVAVAWIRDMPYSVVWLPDDRIAILNARVPRRRLAEALEEYLPEMLDGHRA